MVHGNSSDTLEPVWKALASTDRRLMLDYLSEEPLTTGALCDRFPDLSRFSVMQHLRVLESADLVIPRREGRLRFNHLNPVPIQMIHDRWVSRYQQPWAEVLLSLRDDIEGVDVGAQRSRSGQSKGRSSTAGRRSSIPSRRNAG